MNWILAEPAREAEVNNEVRRTAEAALKETILGAISTETRARLTPTLSNMTVREILTVIEERFIDRTEERQEELRTVAKKICMKRNSNVSEYINKHRVLRKDMINAGCKEIEGNNEKATIRHIINGLEGNEAWENFKTSWKMIPAKVRPSTID